MQGDYNVQGGPIGGGGGVTPAAGTPFALTWDNFSALIDTSGPPTFDINGLWVSGSSDATGTSVTFNNLSAAVGHWSAIQLHQGTLGVILPAWNPQTQLVYFRMTPVTVPAGAVGAQMAVSFNDGAARTANARGFGYYYNGTDRCGNWDAFGLVTSAVTPPFNITGPFGWDVPRRPNFSVQNDTGVRNTNPLAGFGAANPIVSIDVDCTSNTNNGPHTIKVLIEYALSTV